MTEKSFVKVREIVFYQTDYGEKPVEEFLAALEPAPRAKVVWTLELLRTQPFVPSKFWQKMRGTENLWECGSNMRGTSTGFWPAPPRATG